MVIASDAASRTPMEQLVIPLSAPEATDAGRFGPKAANLAILGRAGLPIPDGFCLDAQAYRIQVSALGLEASAREAFATDDRPQARRCALAMRLGLLDQPIVPAVLDPLVAAWRARVPATAALSVVRSSALVEDRYGSSFAGQFESFLGLESEVEFVTAVRSCWAALWSTRALRYMATHDLNPAETAMALLVQPLVAARASGGGLSRTADGGMRVSATWGLGSAIAQGEGTPAPVELSRDGALLPVGAGRKDHSVGCVHRQEPTAQAVPRELVTAPCLNATQAVELGRLLRKVEDIMGMPVEIEWALDDTGFKLLQARPLHMQPAQVPDEIWLGHRARVCGQLRVRAYARGAGRRPGDAGGGSGAEPGAATRGGRGGGARRQHLAPRRARARAWNPHGPGRARCHAAHPRWRTGCRGRCRGCGALDPLMRPRVFITQPVAASAIERLRAVAEVNFNPDPLFIIDKDALCAAVREHDILFCLLHDRVDADVIAANPGLRAVASMKS